MKPEELARYERMYRAMEKLMGTKLLRFSFPGHEEQGCDAHRSAPDDEGRNGCKGSVGSL